MKSLKLIGLALGASLALSTTALAQDITIAVAGPMTGGESAFGRQLKNGAEQAVADINAAGGVLGKKLVLEVGDDACDPEAGALGGGKVRQREDPVRGRSLCSSSSIPASEAYADGNVLQITPASTNPLFTERKLWNVLRVCGRDDQQGMVAAEYIAEELQGQERRHPQRQDHLRQRPRRRNQEGAQQGRRHREDVRVLQQGRQGL